VTHAVTDTWLPDWSVLVIRRIDRRGACQELQRKGHARNCVVGYRRLIADECHDLANRRDLMHAVREDRTPLTLTDRADHLSSWPEAYPAICERPSLRNHLEIIKWFLFPVQSQFVTTLSGGDAAPSRSYVSVSAVLMNL
jgi:hypothetical protein